MMIAKDGQNVKSATKKRFRRNCDMSDLRMVPDIGAKKEKELIQLGYDSLAALKGADPEELYVRASLQAGK